MSNIDKLFEWVEHHLPEVIEYLNPPARSSEIEAAEALLSVKFPEELRALYLRHNGQNEERASALPNGEQLNETNIHLLKVIPGLFYGLEFLPLDKMVSQWESWASHLEGRDISTDEMNELSSSYRAGFVKPVYINTKWIPLTSGSDHLGLDFDPGPKGTMGQVINFGRDEDVKYVIATSFGEFLDWYVKQLEAGNYIIEEWDGSGTGRVFLIKSPENQHFLDAIKELFD